MVYELIATNIDIQSCEMKCKNQGGILPQDFRMLAIDDIYISGTVKLWKSKAFATYNRANSQVSKYSLSHVFLQLYVRT